MGRRSFTRVLVISVQHDVDTLYNWADKWQMEFNIGKCKTMHFGARNAGQDYLMHGQKLETVTVEKDLGVSVSNDLKVFQQCTQACNKANRMLGLIRRTISSRNQQILTRLYKTLVRPHLEYCSAAWSPYYIKDKERIEKVQHRFTRFFSSLRPLDYEKRLDRLGLWTLEERRNRADLVELFKMYKGLSSVPLETFFTRDTDSVTRGHSGKLKKQFSRTDIRQHFFSNRVVSRWNYLPADAINSGTVNTFKSHLLRIKKNRMGWFMDHSPLQPYGRTVKD